MVLTGEAASKSGSSVIFSFLIARLACGLTALCYAELSSTIPSSGSVYTYSYITLGDTLAYVLGEVGQGKLAGVVSLGAVISLLSGSLGTMFAAVRVLYTMSRDGLLPRQLSILNRSGIPGSTTIGVGLLMTILTGFLPLGQLADLANVSYIIAFALVSYATFIIRRDYPNAKRGFTMPGMPYLPIISILLFIVLLYGIQLSTWIIFGCWILVGLAIYFIYSKNHSKEK